MEKRIIRYLSDEMSASEREAFEKEINADQALAQKVEAARFNMHGHDIGWPLWVLGGLIILGFLLAAKHYL